MATQSEQRCKLLMCVKTCDPNITIRQMALLALVGAETTTVREAALTMGVTRPVVSRGCRALTRKGFITKTVKKEDRRVVLLAITDAGRRFLKHLPF